MEESAVEGIGRGVVEKLEAVEDLSGATSLDSGATSLDSDAAIEVPKCKNPYTSGGISAI